MKRANKNTQINLETYTATVARAALAVRLGQQQYGGDRDIYQALGYKIDIQYDDYLARYLRQDIAKAIIDRPVKATWQGELILLEPKQKLETAFEKAWVDLDSQLYLKSIFSRVDRLTGIGRYGVLLFGLDDVKKQEDFRAPIKSGNRKLVYLKAFGEGCSQILEYEPNPNNPRYGKPTIYNLTINEVNGVTLTIAVHYTRVLHIVNDSLESDIDSSPRLEVVFNRLMDLEKLVGGDAEMFWRGARPGFQGKLDPEYQMTQTVKNDLKEQVDEYEHNLRRILVNQGLELKALDQQISDPSNHVDVQIQMISAVTGIPKRILIGSERGELSSAQDSQEWKTFVNERRGSYAEINIIRPFVTRMIELGILPKPSTGKYSVKWNDIFAISEKDRVEIGKGRATAVREYASNPIAEQIIPPQAFMEFFLGFDNDQIDMINEMQKAQIDEEGISMQSIDEQLLEETQKQEQSKTE